MRYNSCIDNLDSVVGQTDSSTGSKDNSYDDNPSGQMRNQQEQSGLNNPWKFAAGYLDSSTGLYKFGTRYDDPTLGRWTQQDPVAGSLGDLGSANRYTYAGDDPVNAVDPSGKDSTSFALCVVGGILAVASFIGGLLQVSWAVTILSSAAPEIIAADGAAAVVINALIPGGLLILAALVGYVTLLLTVCAFRN
jgi:RHS repeat-associated protein